jgi:hypothetical protein
MSIVCAFVAVGGCSAVPSHPPLGGDCFSDAGAGCFGGSPGGAGGGVPVDGSTAPDSASGSGSACGITETLLAAEDSGCPTCVEQYCCSEDEACSTGDCYSLVECMISQCQTGTASTGTCAGNCENSYATGAGDYAALASCLAQSCSPSPCPVLPTLP